MWRAERHSLPSTIWTYSSSVGQVRLSRQNRSIPCPRCKFNSSSTVSLPHGASCRPLGTIPADQTTYAGARSQTPLTRHSPHQAPFRTLHLYQLLHCEKVDVIRRVDRLRHAVDGVRDWDPSSELGIVFHVVHPDMSDKSCPSCSASNPHPPESPALRPPRHCHCRCLLTITKHYAASGPPAG